MLRRQFLKAVVGTGAMTTFPRAFAAPAQADSIKLIAPFPPGAAVDTIARIFGDAISASLDVPVYVLNKVGANGTIGSSEVARAAPDGGTILMNSSTLVQAPLVMAKPPYDPVKDFTSLFGMGTTPQAFVINAATPAKTLEEFAQYAAGKSFSYGTYGPGTTPHAFVQLFANQNKLDMLHVPYKGEGAMAIDLIGGRIECAMGTMTTLGPHIRSGRLRALACLGETRIPSLPATPTFLERGYPREFSWGGFIAFFGPKGMPLPVSQRIANALSEALQLESVRQKLQDLDMIVRETKLDQTQALVEQSYQIWSKVSRELKLAETA